MFLAGGQSLYKVQEVMVIWGGGRLRGRTLGRKRVAKVNKTDGQTERQRESQREERDRMGRRQTNMGRE